MEVYDHKAIALAPGLHFRISCLNRAETYQASVILAVPGDHGFVV